MKNKLFNLLLILTFFATITLGSKVFALDSALLIEKVNQSRSEQNLAPLEANDLLTQAALNKAKDILEKDYFSHNNPQGKTPWDFIKQANYNYAYAGENLGIGFWIEDELHSKWMESPLHRENILNSNYRQIGIATLEGDFQNTKTVVAVQLFGTLKTDLAQLPTQNKSVFGDSDNLNQPQPALNAENNSRDYSFKTFVPILLIIIFAIYVYYLKKQRILNVKFSC